PTGRPPPFDGDRPPAPLCRQDRARPLLSPLPSRLLRCRVNRPNSRGPDDATRKGPAPSFWKTGGGAGHSTTQTQALDQRVVALAVPGLEIIEQPAALADQLQQAAARMVILRVTLEMLGEVGDALAQDGDLDFRRAGVGVALGVRLDQLRLARGRNRHRSSPSN